MRSLFRTRRRTFAFGLAVVAGLVATYLYFGGTARPNSPEWDIHDLKVGMTREQVWAVIGCPPGVYAKVPPGFSAGLGNGDVWVTEGPPQSDESGDVYKHYVKAVRVLYDDDGRMENREAASYMYSSYSSRRTVTNWCRWALRKIGF